MKFLDRYKETVMRFMGLAIFIVTLTAFYNQTIPFIWEALAGIIVGTIMFWKPATLISLALGIIKSLTKKLIGNGSKEQDPEVL